jgi:DNA-directed RNA polymerase subunit RPC12/RpoP
VIEIFNLSVEANIKTFPNQASIGWGKVELPEAVSDLNVNLKTALGAVAVAVLFFFGIIFAWSTGADIPAETKGTRLIVATMMFVVGFGIAYYITRKPKTIIQRLEVSGQMEAVALKCPNCSASVDSSKIKIVSGVPYATCPYCGNTFEVAEEPKW